MSVTDRFMVSIHVQILEVFSLHEPPPCSSRRKEAHFSLLPSRMSEPPHVGCYRFMASIHVRISKVFPFHEPYRGARPLGCRNVSQSEHDEFFHRRLNAALRPPWFMATIQARGSEVFSFDEHMIWALDRRTRLRAIKNLEKITLHFHRSIISLLIEQGRGRNHQIQNTHYINRSSWNYPLSSQ